MDKDERKKFDEEIARSYCRKAIAAREGDSASLSCTVWSRLNGGKSTSTDGLFDTGCTHTVTTTAKIEGLKMEIEPLREVSEIIQADGSCRIFLESDKLGERRMIDCAVIDGGKAKRLSYL